MRYLARVLAVVGAAAVLIIPMVIALNSQPMPAPVTPSPMSGPSPTSSQSAAGPSEPIPIAAEEIVVPGQTATIAAVDGSGVWGSIELTRAEESGGWPHYAVASDVFVMEVRVEYRAHRVPYLEESGPVDWTLITAGGAAPVGRLIYPQTPFDTPDWEPIRHPLSGGYSTLVDVLSVPVRGTLYFEVPRVVEDRPLLLLYRPRGFSTAVIGIAVREPGIAPGPVPTATPVPTPVRLGYVQREGLPFAIIDNPVADALFVSLDTCLNEEDGYRLSFPASWYTNTQIGEVPPCTWFAPNDFMAPTLFAVRPEFQPPDGVVIIVMAFEGGSGYLYSPTFTIDEVISVAGFEGWRREQIGECGLPEGCRSLPPRYEYELILGSEGEAFGPTFLAVTSSEGVANYELNKAVLDRMLASLEFIP